MNYKSHSLEKVVWFLLCVINIYRKYAWVVSLKYKKGYYTLHEKCQYSEFFWSVFSRICTEYREILRISPHSVSLRTQSECGKIRTKKTPNTKTFHAVTIANTFQKILDESGRKQNKILLDKGNRFYNWSLESRLHNNDIEIYEGTSAVSQRFIRTLKNTISYTWPKYRRRCVLIS